MGFDKKWIDLIKWCIFTSRFSVLVNGALVDFFQSFKGLRQQDPISPHLFVLAIEALNCLLKKTWEGGYMLRFNVSGGGVSLFFVC